MSKKRYLIIVGFVLAAVLISILLYKMLVNYWPAITGLSAEPERVPLLGSCQIVCNATDRNGDKLSYNWSASGGAITGEGATVNWTAPNSSGSYNVTVIVTDGRGGEVTDYVTIPVRTNKPPEIISLTASAAWTTLSGTLQMMCDAWDPDRDKLSYEWTTTGGDISGASAAVNWTAPQEVGVYNITTVVTDGYGGKTIRFVTLCVDHVAPPPIQNLSVKPKGHIFLRKSTTGRDYDVWMNKEYDIECQVADTSGELSYTWSCDDGGISRAGSTITWTAPNKKSTDTVSVDVTVTVIVSDAAGNSVAKNIVFHIPTCTCGSWE